MLQAGSQTYRADIAMGSQFNAREPEEFGIKRSTKEPGWKTYGALGFRPGKIVSLVYWRVLYF